MEEVWCLFIKYSQLGIKKKEEHNTAAMMRTIKKLNTVRV